MLIDAGGLFFKSTKMPKSLIDKKKETASLIINIYNRLEYQLYNVGYTDLIGGFEFVKQVEDEAEFPFVSANLQSAENQELLFEPYQILRAGKTKIGIIGITSKPVNDVDGVFVDDPIETARNYAEEIKEKVDYVVLLAAVNNSDDTKLRKADIAADFILFAGSYRTGRYLQEDNGKLIARCGGGGKYIGLIQVKIEEKDSILSNVSKDIYQLDYSRKRIKSYKDKAGDKKLEDFYADNEQVLRIINSIQRNVEKLSARVKSAVNTVNYELVELDKHIVDDNKIRQLLDEHKNNSRNIIKKPYSGK